MFPGEDSSPDSDSAELTDESVFLAYTEQACRCIYCRAVLGARGASRFLVDRKDPFHGHKTSNIVLSCLACRQLRGEDYSFEEFHKFR